MSAGTQPASAKVKPVRAQTSVRAKTTATASYGILIGPIKAKGGFSVQLEVDNCGTASSGLLVQYMEGSQAAMLDHSYQGAAPHCSVSSDLGRTVLKVKWGNVLDFNLEMAGTGKLDEEKVDSSCGTSFFESRNAQSSGSAVIAIHQSDLGRIRFSRVTAHVLGEGSTGCKAASGAGTLPLSGSGSEKWFAKTAERTSRSTPSHGTTTIPVPNTAPPTGTKTSTLPTIDADGSGSRFLAVFDQAQSLVITASSQSPYNPLTIINDRRGDSPASGVTGTMSVALNTTDAFTADAGDSNAQLVANAVFAKGILSFTATRDCSNVSDALDGTLTGTISVKDPIFGTITYSGSKAVGAAVGNADASLDTC